MSHYIITFLMSLMLIFHICDSTSLVGIKYCQIGLGPSGKRALLLALKKGVTLVAAFTQTSFIGMDVADILSLDHKIGIVVSSSTDLNKVLQDTKPDICHDATKDDLKSVYDHFKVVLSNGVNIITLASHLIYPYKSDDMKMAADLDKIAKENEATLCVTGIQDTYYQMNVLSMMSSMNYITRLDVSWIPKTDEVSFWNNKGNEETKSILEPFTIQMVKWYAAQLQWNQLSLQCLSEYRETIDEQNNIRNNEIIGIWNLTCVFCGYTNQNEVEKLYIIWRNEFYAGNDNNKNGMVVKLMGDPDQEMKVKDIPYGVSTKIAINRIQQVIDAKPGFYSIHKLGIANMVKSESVQIPQIVKQDL